MRRGVHRQRRPSHLEFAAVLRRPIGADDEHREVLDPVGHQSQQLQGQAVGAVQVVENDGEGLTLCDLAQHVGDRVPQPERAGLGTRDIVQQRSQHLSGVVLRTSGLQQVAQHLGPCPPRRRAVHLRATAQHGAPARGAQPGCGGTRQSGLARAGFTSDPQHCAATGGDSACGGVYFGEFLGPTVGVRLDTIGPDDLRYHRLRRTGRLQMVCLAEDVALKVAQCAAGFQAEFIDEVTPGAPQHLQRVALASALIERCRQHRGGPFPLRTLADMPVQRGDGGAVPAQFDLCRRLCFHGCQPQLGEPGDLGRRPQRIACPGERISRPAGQRLVQQAHALLRIRFLVRRSYLGLELPRVDGVDGQPQTVSRRSADQDAGRGPALPSRLEPTPQM